MQESDRIDLNSLLEHLQGDYVETGRSDQGQLDWAVDLNWDFYASCLGRHPMLAYIALSENESIGRERHYFMQKLRPVVRENNRASEVLPQYREHAPNTSDTNTNPDNDTVTDSENSRPQPVRSSPCRTAEAMLSDEKEPSEPSKTQDFENAEAFGLETVAEKVLSDQKEPSELKTVAEEVLSDQKEPGEPSKARIPSFDYAKAFGL